MIRFDKEELATVLAALRMFQRNYEDRDAFHIRRDWPEHFRTNGGRTIKPLGSEDIDALCERINTDNSDQIDGPKVKTASKKRACHHPQGGFCAECIAPGLNAVLSREMVSKIDEFAAHWIESEDRLPGFATRLREMIEREVGADRHAIRIRKAAQ